MLARRSILCLATVLVILAIASSYLVMEVARLNEELTTLKRESGEYSYDADWVTRFVGYNPITSAEEARQVYLMLIDKAPKKLLDHVSSRGQGFAFEAGDFRNRQLLQGEWNISQLCS